MLNVKITWVDQFVALVAVDQAATKRSPIDRFELLPVLIPIKHKNLLSGTFPRSLDFTSSASISLLHGGCSTLQDFACGLCNTS